MARKGLFKEIFQNFLNSLKPKKYWGELRGKDCNGTEYYEAPQSLQGHRRPSRWFTPVIKDNFEQEIPTEWKAWLTHRRKEPPTEEEIELNRQKMLSTIAKAQKLQKLEGKTEEIQKKTSSFPQYEEYQIRPQTGKD